MRTTFFTISLAAGAAIYSIAACSGDSDNSVLPSGGSGPSSGTSSAQGGDGAGGSILTGTSSGGNTGAGGGCASQSAEATLVKKPVDIIFVIDNSGSMTQEIVGVQNNINQNFASIIAASGVDYRVILLARHGSATNGQSVCIEAPLSTIAAGGCTNPPAQPQDNPPIFYHHSVEVASHNSLCLALQYFDQPDEFNLHPMGWGSLLRDDAYKVFVEVTDDGVSCSFNGTTYNDGDSIAGGQTVATNFDAALLALSPTHFGTDMARNYRFYSMIALANLDPNNPALPWLPTDPMTTSMCPTAADPGTGYQALSILTEGLRFPLCEPNYYDVVFNEIAQGVISGAQVACNFPVPAPPNGEQIDLNTVTVNYTPMGTGTPQTFTQVPTANDCVPNSFYIDMSTNEIVLCPDACTLVQADDAAKIDIVFQCIGDIQ